jgi:thymidine phosphorylase
MSTPMNSPAMRLVRAGIDTHREPVVYMRADCDVCRSEGFEAQTRVWVELGDRSLIATLNVVRNGGWLPAEVAALSESAWHELRPSTHERATFRHADTPDSARSIRAKVYGRPLNRADYLAIVRDTLDGTLTDLDIAAFLTACASRNLDDAEVTALTLAMVDAGERLAWRRQRVLDKHCVGGLAGNRTTPVVVAIVAACGGVIPKTSSRAITSPAGTADAMETLAPVDLSLPQMRRVVENEGGCVVWGGAVGLSPADDALIRIERALDFDSEAQLVASVLSKKLAAGSTHVVLDLPVGPTAKVRTAQAAQLLGARLEAVARALGLTTRVLLTDGSQPVGNAIGPALEARAVMAVLDRTPDAAPDLRDRALQLAGAVLELGGLAEDGYARARDALDDGSAARKFGAICEAQGGRREPPRALHTRPLLVETPGRVIAVDNRLLSRIAKLAGAPRSPQAGIELHARLGSILEKGAPLLTVHAATQGELEYALAYYRHHGSPFSVVEGT